MKLDPSSFLDLAIDLGRVLDRKVDIIDLHSVDASFKQIIEKDQVALPGFEGSY